MITSTKAVSSVPFVVDIFEKKLLTNIDASEAGKPALAACVNEIEAYFDNQQNPTLDLTDGFTRTVVGRMIKTALSPFGYEVTVISTANCTCLVTDALGIRSSSGDQKVQRFRPGITSALGYNVKELQIGCRSKGGIQS